jgi:hypothetical protein
MSIRRPTPRLDGGGMKTMAGLRVENDGWLKRRYDCRLKREDDGRFESVR